MVFCLFAFLSLSLFAQVTKESCTKEDFSARFGPVRDQGDAGFCYSFTAADLVSEALELTAENQLSPLHFGAHYVSMSQEEVREANKGITEDYGLLPTNKLGGMGLGPMPDPVSVNTSALGSMGFLPHDPKGAPLLAREGGYAELIMGHMLQQAKLCQEKNAPSETKNSSANNSQFFLMQMGYNGGGDDMNAFYKAKNEGTLNDECPLFKEFGSFIGTAKELKAAMNDYAAERLRKAIDDKCQFNNPKKKLTVKTRTPYPNTADSTFMELIDRKRPFGISYDSCSLTDCPEFTNGRHSSIVIGREWNGKNCMIKIRNSWGTTCQNVKPGVECKDGIWKINIGELSKVTNRVQWIDNESP